MIHDANSSSFVFSTTADNKITEKLMRRIIRDLMGINYSPTITISYYRTLIKYANEMANIPISAQFHVLLL